MTPAKFKKLVDQYFGEALCSFGFTSDGSKYAVFHRKVSEDVYHVISTQLGSRGTWFRVYVFTTSPCIEPNFNDDFPDELGIPSDWLSTLDPKHGVGPNGKQYLCNMVHRK